MPVIFAGHGSPMNALEDNRWSRGFRELVTDVPTPRAILAISAHWYTRGTLITDNQLPPTIHDFSGFPRALHEVSYPARGSVDLAKRVRSLIALDRVALRSDWGLDHGTWSVLRWMYPDADVPVIQLSMARHLREPAHFDIGRSLMELRHEGVLIVGSGNMVHNLGDAISQIRSRQPVTPTWASNFDETAAEAISQRDTDTLLSAWSTDDGRLAHPSPDHWLPLLYALGATDDDDHVRFHNTGFDWGSISMRSVVWS